MKDKIHPKIQEVLEFEKHGTVLDGAFAVGDVADTSAEIIKLDGMDISSLNTDGVCNTEHVSAENKQFKEGTKEQDGFWGTIIGRVIFAKKIYSEEDCESDRELDFWKKIEFPFLYGAVELFDADGHENAKSAAAIVRHHADRKLPVIARWSIEGSTLKRDGNILESCIARRVALTIKPCNKAAISDIVADADANVVEEKSNVEETIVKSEDVVSVHEMEYYPLLQKTSPLEDLRDSFRELKSLTKALTLGSGNVAPGNLVGGSALAVEDLGEKKKVIKSQALAALRDWPMTMPFKDFLKTKLPEADESFIDRFSDMVEDYKLKGLKLVKSEEQMLNSLKELDQKPPKGAIVYKNKYIEPGEIEITAGPFEGSKVKLFYLDDNYAYVQPFKASDQVAVKVNKLNRNFENAHFKILQEPKIIKENVPNFVHGDKHTNPGLTESLNQKYLAHGIDLASPPLLNLHPHGATEAHTKGIIGWFKSAHDKTGYVKPSVKFDHDGLNGQSGYLATALRETIFHNVAKNFFGLGQFVPNTVSFKHPETGEDHSISELVRHAEHVQIKDRGAMANDRLIQAGDLGDLDKLAVMDIVMGLADRHRLNYITAPENPHIFLIDNQLLFNYQDTEVPSYLYDYHFLKTHQDWTGQMMHPGALQWLVSLDPFRLGAELTRQGVAQELVVQAVGRLMSMQSEAILGKKDKNSILFAHTTLTNDNNPLHNEVLELA